MTGSASLGEMFRVLRDPVPREKKELLAERWQTLSPEVRTSGQGFGRQATGCGATIGVLPKCDFDCQGCYLGADANQAAPLSLEEVFAQLEELRAWLGPKGNVQITDGEVTLRPEDELVAILRKARELGMIPMLMTHGDTFRRKPDLLTRLVKEGGLTEVSIHVDSTQRGRRGEYREARTEVELMPLRAEFAELILRVRRETGVRLRAATTLTITRDNLGEVPEVVAWALANRNAFGLISFQPLAQVGRTREHLEGVTADELWAKVGEVLAPHGFDPRFRTPLQLGHPDCTRMEAFAVYEEKEKKAQLLPVIRGEGLEDESIVRRFFELGLGGLNFRDDPLPVRISRGIGCLVRAPGWFLGTARRWVAERCRGLGRSPARVLWDSLRGASRLDSFMVVSHHFMSPGEAETETGRQRLDACVFRLPVDGRMVPMCEVNTQGVRDRVYQIGDHRAVAGG